MRRQTSDAALQAARCADAGAVPHEFAEGLGVETACFCGAAARRAAGRVGSERLGGQPFKALRGNGLDVVATHLHMTDVHPVVIFLHYYGTGPAAGLAKSVRAAVDLLGKAPASR